MTLGGAENSPTICMRQQPLEMTAETCPSTHGEYPCSLTAGTCPRRRHLNPRKGQSPTTEYSTPNQQLHLVSMTPPAGPGESQSLWPKGTWLQMKYLQSAKGLKQKGQNSGPVQQLDHTWGQETHYAHP